MAHQIETQWMGKMQFNALVNGHTIVMDAPEKVGGEDRGPIPKPFVLTALSGCTGMDIVSILRNARKEVTSFAVLVEGELSKSAPIQYISIHLTYQFEGIPEHKDAALHAVQLSQQQYCGVSSMLKKIMPVTWDVWYNGQLLFSNKLEKHEQQPL